MIVTPAAITAARMTLCMMFLLRRSPPAEAPGEPPVPVLHPDQTGRHHHVHSACRRGEGSPNLREYRTRDRAHIGRECPLVKWRQTARSRRLASFFVFERVALTTCRSGGLWCGRSRGVRRGAGPASSAPSRTAEEAPRTWPVTWRPRPTSWPVRPTRCHGGSTPSVTGLNVSGISPLRRRTRSPTVRRACD